MNETDAKKIIEECGVIQERDPDSYNLPCPRCGHPMPHQRVTRNALSRFAAVYVCPDCGVEEALMSALGMPPTPFTEWSLVESLGSNRV